MKKIKYHFRLSIYHGRKAIRSVFRFFLHDLPFRSDSMHFFRPKRYSGHIECSFCKRSEMFFHSESEKSYTFMILKEKLFPKCSSGHLQCSKCSIAIAAKNLRSKSEKNAKILKKSGFFREEKCQLSQHTCEACGQPLPPKKTP